MTCGGCVAKVKFALEKITQIQEAKVQLEFPQAEIKATESVDVKTLQGAIGHYQISVAKPPKISLNIDLPEKTISTYRPLI